MSVVCEPGIDRVCLDSATGGVCNDTGTGYAASPCTGGRDCNIVGPKVCVEPWVCVPGDRRCVGLSAREMCNAIGTGWEADAPCSGAAPTCFSGACETKCDTARRSQSYTGCEYWGADLGNIFTDADDMFTFAFVVGNSDPNDTAIVQLSTELGVLATQTVEPGAIGVFEIPPPRLRNNAATGKRKTAYHLTSDVPVAVYQFNPLATAEYNAQGKATRLAASTDAAMLLPAHALDDRYLVLAWEQTPTPGVPVWQSYTGGSLLAVVAAGEAVEVTITPTAGAGLGLGVTGVLPGVAKTWTLQPYEVLQLTTLLPGNDYTGTTITATGKIAVFAGNECGRVPATGNYCDHLEEQLFGLTAWGKEIVATKSWPRGAEADIYRVLAEKDGTTVSFNPTVSAALTLNAGEFVDVETDADFVITATQPVLVAQFFEGSSEVVPNCTPYTCSETGDPSMVLLPPTEQFRQNYVFLTPDTYQSDYVNIVGPAGCSVTLDGEFIELDDTVTPAFCVVRLVVTDGPHVLTSACSVGLMVYGYGGDDDHPLAYGPANVSYGYPGGLNFLPINPKQPD